MTNVTVTVALQAAQFPAATPEVASIRIEIAQGEGVIARQDVAPTEPVSAVFPSMAPGDYTAAAQSVSADGTAIGSPMAAAFNVPQPDVDRMVPASVTVNLA